MSQKVDLVLDTSGLICPEPVMLLHKSVRGLLTGNTVEVIATDPATTRDIPKFCHFLGHDLLVNAQEGSQYRYVIRKN